MALSYTNARMKQLHTSSEVSQVPVQKFAPPGLLQCLMLSWSEDRVRLLRRAAEAEAWDTIVCSDSMQFVRMLFQKSMPLTLVDLPPNKIEGYGDFVSTAERTKEITNALMILSVAEGNDSAEIWARELGVWSYLPDLNQQKGWEIVFRDARQALARQATVYLESNTQIKHVNEHHR